MKRTKWASHQFSETERRARRLWRQSSEKRTTLANGLRMIDRHRNRTELHKRLDWVMDGIEANEQKARDLFPEVDDSFTIATETIRI